MLPNPFGHPSSLASAMLFRRGAIAVPPCTHCARGKGRFPQCVIISPRTTSALPTDYFNGVCANCLSAGVTHLARVVANATGNVHAPAQAPARRRGRPAINAARLATPSNAQIPVPRLRGCPLTILISEAIRVAPQVAAPNKAPEPITADGRALLFSGNKIPEAS